LILPDNVTHGSVIRNKNNFRGQIKAPYTVAAVNGGFY